MLPPTLVLLLSASQLVFGNISQDQHVILPAPEGVPHARAGHVVDKTILAALEKHPDPVDALLSLHPEYAADLAQPRLLHVIGESKAEWMTEGDKLHLRRQGKKFFDITDHEDFYLQQIDTLSGKASKKHLQFFPVSLLTYF